MNSEVIKNFQYKRESPNQIHVHEIHKFTCINCVETILTIKLKKSVDLKESCNDIENLLSLHLMGCEKYHQNVV